MGSSQHVLLFPQSFLPCQTQKSLFSTPFDLSSANVLNSVHPKMLSLGKWVGCY